MRRWSHILWSCAALAALSACDLVPTQTDPPDPAPRAQASPPAPELQPEPEQVSPRAQELQRYYAQVQRDLLARGLLRTDGGGIDTPYTDVMLARNFERIALAEEYARGAGLQPSSGEYGEIKKWTVPVRVGIVFGDSLSKTDQAEDRRKVDSYVRRLARVSGHPISLVSSQPNFHVLVMGEDDRDMLRDTLDRIAPNMEASSRAIFLNVPRSIHCLVVAFSQGADSSAYRKAVALVRTEHPDLTRLTCYHEEIAQGLGLANDDPRARPSIFNDDEEFALLTSHDELLLKMLYDPRLTPGMSLDEARPIVRVLAQELVGGGPS